MDVSATRRENLRRLVESGSTQTAMAERLEMTISYFNQLYNGHRNIGERTARKIEKSLGLSVGHLDSAEIITAEPEISTRTQELPKTVQAIASALRDVPEQTRIKALAAVQAVIEQEKARMRAELRQLESAGAYMDETNKNENVRADTATPSPSDAASPIRQHRGTVTSD